MRQIAECVPNISEGRDPQILTAVADAVRDVPGAKLISAEPDRDYNRTVITFIGEPRAVSEAAFRLTVRATELIDMRVHRGGHPRLGAVDVVPFVPVEGITMGECADLARAFGRRVGEVLGIPVYLYEEAASRPERKNLATIRKGEYEGLEEKLRDPEWRPDFGPAVFNARSGAVVTGARMFLIAYNVNLDTADVSVANEIALRIRESGRIVKDGKGAPLLDDRGKKVMVPGTLKSVKAMGVLLEAHNIAQVSMNLVNFQITPPHVAFEEVKRQAADLGVGVTGSEIVGLAPARALTVAGTYYAPGLTDERELIRAAVMNLGLNQLGEFDVRQKIIEFQL